MDKHENELAGSFALNALEDEERARLLREAKDSRPLRDELDSMSEAAGLLGLSADPVAPPPRLKANIMAAIAQTEQAPPAEPSAAPQTAPAEDESATAAPAAEKPASGSGSGKGQRNFFALAAGVLLVAALGLGGLVISQNADQRELQDQLSAMSDHQEELSRILGAADAQSKSQTLEDGAQITLTYSASEGLMAVATSDMPSLPSDKAYELWLISADGAVSAGLLDGSHSDGMMLLSDPMDGVTHFGISVEPSTGSPAPTTDPIMVQSL